MPEEKSQEDQIKDDPQYRPGDVTREAQKDLARPNQEAGDKLPQSNASVPNPVPADPTDPKEADAIQDATPGIAQAITTLNPHQRRQDSNRANDPIGESPDNEVNINGVNIQDTPGRLAHDPNFAKRFQEEAQDEANNPIVNGGKVRKLDLKKVKYDDGLVEDGTSEEPISEPPKGFDKEDLRQKDESQQDYNERVPVGEQPIEQSGQFDYLGRKRA